MKDECKLITLQEVADALCTTRQTVSNWCSFGVFKTRKIGKCIYIDRDTFDVVRDSLSDLERTKESIRELKHDLSEMKKFLRCQQAEIKAAIGVATRIGRPSRLGGIVKPLCDLAYYNNDPVSVKKGYKILQMLAEGKTLQFIAKNVFHCSIAALTFDAARALKKLSRLQNYTSLVEENKSLKEDLLSLQTRFSFIPRKTIWFIIPNLEPSWRPLLLRNLRYLRPQQDFLPYRNLLPLWKYWHKYFP